MNLIVSFNDCKKNIKGCRIAAHGVAEEFQQAYIYSEDKKLNFKIRHHVAHVSEVLFLAFALTNLFFFFFSMFKYLLREQFASQILSV